MFLGILRCAVRCRTSSGGNNSQHLAQLTLRRYHGGGAVPPLRDYQAAAISSCVNSITNGVKRIGVSLATGGGKTVIFAHLINELAGKHNRPFRSLILVHRRELALQAVSTIKKFSIQQQNVQMEMGKYDCDVGTADVIVASVQSLVRRLPKYTPESIDLIIIDEAHHAVANSYLTILKHFKADTPNTRIPVVGFSATFERTDQKALSAVIDEIVYHKGILQMVDERWLCEGKFTTVNVNVELANIECTINDDFKLPQLSKVMNTDKINNIILQTYLHMRSKHKLRSTLLFGVDVQHVTALYQIFSAAGIKARYVTGTTNDTARDEIVKDFKSGRIEVLLNCGIFTEGTDMPNIDCILLCRPTRSRPLLIQMIGRGLRKHSTKDYCHIIDFIGSKNVGVISVPTLFGIPQFEGVFTNKTMEDLEAIKKDIESRTQLAKQNMFFDVSQALENVESFDLTLTTFDDFESFTASVSKSDKTLQPEVALLNESRLPWVKFAKDAWALSLQSAHHLRIYKDKGQYILKLYRELPKYLRERTDARYAPTKLSTDSNLSNIISKVDTVLRGLKQDDGTSKNFTRFARWRKERATARQASAIYGKLERQLDPSKYPSLTPAFLLNYTQQLTRGEAANILFAASLAPVYPLCQLLRTLEYKARLDQPK